MKNVENFSKSWKFLKKLKIFQKVDFFFSKSLNLFKKLKFLQKVENFSNTWTTTTTTRLWAWKKGSDLKGQPHCLRQTTSAYLWQWSHQGNTHTHRKTNISVTSCNSHDHRNNSLLLPTRKLLRRDHSTIDHDPTSMLQKF